MSAFFHWLLSSTGFMPHGHCFLWQPATLWLNAGSDALIAAAYYMIPFSLYYFVRQRRREIPYPWLLLMFAAFIFLCGSTHLMEIWTIWHPDYRAAGALKALTGIVSFATSISLFRLLPEALKLRSPRELTLEVRARTAELAALNARLREEIEARDKAHAQLRELDRRKDEFLATLAHELRNPLAPILHASQLLTQGGEQTQSTAQRVWARGVIERQAQRMAALLDDLLNVSRITRGRLELRRRIVELHSLVQTAVETSMPLIERRGHRLEQSLPDQPLRLEVDPLRISQALSNLLANAAKFTPVGGRIALEAQLTDQALELRVSDDGVGFDAATGARLFEMFAQGSLRLEGDADSGLGIGLALVKALVELHGGSVEASSAGLDQGARFTLRLPRSVILTGEGMSPNSPMSEPQPAPSPAPPTRRLSVLIVDDNRDAAESLGLILEAAGHAVSLAHDGPGALSQAQTLRPDVLILDIGMPGMSGYELARRVREQSWGATVLLVALTGFGQPEDRQRAHEAGFDHHLTKPVPPLQIERILERHVGSSGAPSRIMGP